MFQRHVTATAMPAPVVALTATTTLIGGRVRVRVNEAYVDAIRGAGLTPLVLPPLEPGELPPVVDAVAGVVLTGGEDVDPGEYGAKRSPATHEPHARRDRCELALAHLARASALPTLAICRGLQAVNVALGGTLVQDIATERPGALAHDLSERRTERVHPVAVEHGSRLARAVGATNIIVNSSHHQAIDTVAAGLRVSARAPDGIIEGAEWDRDDWWMLAVQWHPEELVGDRQPWDRALFSAFAERVRS